MELPDSSALHASLRDFRIKIEASTVACQDGTREFVGVSGGPLLASEAHARLGREYVLFQFALFRAFGRHDPSFGPAYESGESMKIGGPSGCPPAAANAIEHLRGVVSSPPDRMRPGASRWQFGDVLDAEWLASLKAAERSLELLAPETEEWVPVASYPVGIQQRLRKAATDPRRKSKHVKTKIVDGVRLVSREDVERWWPETKARPEDRRRKA